MRIAADLYQQMIDHALEEAPNECCGMLAARDGEAMKVYRVTNIEHSGLRFVMDPQEQYDAWNEIESAGLEPAIYHSHPRTEPRPSETDIRFARDWPGLRWVIIGLADEEPEVRAWRIEDGQVAEAELVVV